MRQNPSNKRAKTTGASAERQGKKRNPAKALLVLLVFVLVFGLLAVFVVKILGKTTPGADVAGSGTVSIPVPVQSEAPSSSASLPSLPVATGEFDVAGIPPLYNRYNPIPDEARAATSLSFVSDGQQMESQAAAAFTAMQNAAAAEGVSLYAVSGYRTLEHQTRNYTSALQNYLSQGYSEEEATRLTEEYYAIPGTSEHEAGLAMDIGSIDDSFANTPAYAWLQEHCTEYGFIYRYEKDFTDTTHIAWEPWHYRFVGVNHAGEYSRLGMHTLEDYVAYLQGLDAASAAA